MRLLLVAVLIHVLFLLSIFYIHFRSPILQNLPDGAEHDAPPADRLVLFIGDGLRAESFLKDGLNRTAFLRETLLHEGVFGVSNTRVPTESRPGHAALLGGVYEDPSAVFRGWKENPVEFDSVLNRSSVSYCWGSPDIVNMFSRGAIQGRVHTAAYDSGDEIFAQSANTSLLDIWVFDRVRQFLVSTEAANANVLHRKKVILFLHLLGLDTAGHVHKPQSELFTENLITVDKGIESIVRLVETATGNDRRTAYLFTSDHGMTDQGSHGSGHPLETETPFLAWGAGFNHWKASKQARLLETRDVLQLDGERIPVHQINQADAAPLMSAVLGISVPKNSFGKLPRTLLNVSEEYAAWAMRNNADQLLQQYYRWQGETVGKWLQWPVTARQTSYKDSIEGLLTKITAASARQQHEQVQILCEALMDVTIEAIQYFQSYYKPHLFFSLTSTMLGWLLFLTKETFTVPDTKSAAAKAGKSRQVLLLAMVFAALVLAVNIVQSTPPVIILYFLVPIVIWGYIGAQWREYVPLFHCQAIVCFIQFVIAIEALVLAFLYRALLLPLLWFHAAYLMKLFTAKQSIAFRWIICNVLLSVFPLIPTTKEFLSNVNLLYGSILVWTVANLLITRASTLPVMLKRSQIMMQLLQSANFAFIVSSIEGSHPVPQLSRTMCWVFTAFGILTPLFARSTTTERLLAVFSGLSGPYMMLSLSFEPLFLLCFCATVYSWLDVEQLQFHPANKATDQLCRLQSHRSLASTNKKQTTTSDAHFRRILAFMLFLLTSFFGTGNLATVSSFDPNSVRCFVTTFSPFTMMGLIVFKLLIPVLILVCALKAVLAVCSIPKTKTFTLTLIVCDGMCLNFFFLVRNQGSWMEIGSSISHFVILECTTIVVMVLYELARFYMEWTVPMGSTGVRQKASAERLPFINKERVE